MISTHKLTVGPCNLAMRPYSRAMQFGNGASSRTFRCTNWCGIIIFWSFDGRRENFSSALVDLTLFCPRSICFLCRRRGKVSAPMTERNPWTAQPPHKINYENSQRNFENVGHSLDKCDTAFEFALCAVKGLLSF